MTLETLISDMCLNFPADVTIFEPPYLGNQTVAKQIDLVYRQLKRSIRLKNRTLSLVNAFYLGKLLVTIDSTVEQIRLKRKLTKHYVTMAEFTFDIFEHNPDQIMRVQVLNVQDIRKLKRSQVLLLRDESFRTDLLVFDGAQNLGGEIANR